MSRMRRPIRRMTCAGTWSRRIIARAAPVVIFMYRANSSTVQKGLVFASMVISSAKDNVGSVNLLIGLTKVELNGIDGDIQDERDVREAVLELD